ncbi:DUF3820 family protein [Marnyiella aurantia]|uniref:DUF3820 family protein n=1 Tax=Marnyiella aurantia TaxID=2758037 RepID=A0A7D7LR98_9FLAO|nr:DUF3820 family protein [Marnyiella aurantia]MBA5247195.1 DUF3820 family protein [Marnyiella aurantia]MBP0613190.1 DUF3820 family protein [Marnyiella aurantia]QMS99596.1 DUF3820 family protein [Marnyiella aurantia]
MNPQILVEICTEKMPFGKYKGVTIADLPVSYLEWFNSKGMPAGKLGMQLSTIYEIKLNGLTELLIPIKKRVRG